MRPLVLRNIKGSPAREEPSSVFAVGNGYLLLRSDRDTKIDVGTAASHLLSMRWQESPCRYAVSLLEAGILLRSEAPTLTEEKTPPRSEVPSSDPLLIASAVETAIYPDRQRNALIGTVRAMHDETLRLCPTEGTTLTVFERYDAARELCCSLKLISASGEILYFFAEGNCHFDPEGNRLRFRPGYAKWVLFLADGRNQTPMSALLSPWFDGVGSTDPLEDPIYRREVKALSSRLSRRAVTRLTPEEEAYRRYLYATTSHNGGILTLGAPFFLDEVCDRLRRYCEDGDLDGARPAVSFLEQLYVTYHDLPYACLGDGGEPSFARHTVDPSAFLVVDALFCYSRTFGLPLSDASISLVEHLLRRWGSCLKGGMLPFSGREENALSYRGDKRFYGSYENTARYFRAAEQALFLVGDRLSPAKRKKAVLDLDFARKHDAALPSEKENAEADPARLTFLRRPASVTGLCDHCASLSLLAHTERGYLCSDCRSSSSSSSSSSSLTTTSSLTTSALTISSFSPQ